MHCNDVDIQPFTDIMNFSPFNAGGPQAECIHDFLGRPTITFTGQKTLQHSILIGTQWTAAMWRYSQGVCELRVRWKEQPILLGVDIELPSLLQLVEQNAVLQRLLFNAVVILKKRPVVGHA